MGLVEKTIFGSAFLKSKIDKTFGNAITGAVTKSIYKKGGIGARAAAKSGVEMAENISGGAALGITAGALGVGTIAGAVELLDGVQENGFGGAVTGGLGGTIGGAGLGAIGGGATGVAIAIAKGIR